MSAALAEGSLFAGRYRIVRLIAQGGMGVVYEVQHTQTNRRRALKVMHPHIFESDELRDRFQREARIAADIDSEHIVDVSDAGIDDASQTPFLVMELLRGEDLAKRVKRLGPIPAREALTYLRQTAHALDKTHAASIVHRDLKPENLFLTQRDDGTPRIKILDFGVAKVIAEGATGHGTENLGTPLYMAPEQFHPGAKLTPAADVFALGMVAYSLLVGVPYWRPESTTAGGLIPFITIAVLGPKQSPVFRATTRNVKLPREFDPWFFRATAFRPEHRFASAGEAIAALEMVFERHLDLESSSQRVEPPITIPPARPSLPSNPQVALTPGTLGLTALSTPTTKTEPSAPLPVPEVGARKKGLRLLMVLPIALFVGIFVVLCGVVSFSTTHQREPRVSASVATSAASSPIMPAPNPMVAPSAIVAEPLVSVTNLAPAVTVAPDASVSAVQPIVAPPSRTTRRPVPPKPRFTPD